MRTRLRRDLTAALKARDRVAIAALRSALAAIENAEVPDIEHPSPRVVDGEHIAGSAVGLGAAEIARRPLTERELHSIIQTEVDERSTAADGYEQLGRNNLAERLRSEANLLRRYLHPAG